MQVKEESLDQVDKEWVVNVLFRLFALKAFRCWAKNEKKMNVKYLHWFFTIRDFLGLLDLLVKKVRWVLLDPLGLLDLGAALEILDQR